MSVTDTIQHINSTVTPFANTVAQTVVAVEQVAGSLPGETKLNIALAAIQAGSATVAQTAPIPAVAGIAALVNLFVSIFNATGIFKKKS